MVSKKLSISYFMFGIGWLLLFLMNRFQNKVGEAVGIVIGGYECIPTYLMCIALFIGTGLALSEVLICFGGSEKFERRAERKAGCRSIGYWRGLWYWDRIIDCLPK